MPTPTQFTGPMIGWLQAPLWQMMKYLSLNRDPSCGQNRPQSDLAQWGKGQLLPFIRKPPNLVGGIGPI
jgi:hypothetical protein